MLIERNCTTGGLVLATKGSASEFNAWTMPDSRSKDTTMKSLSGSSSPGFVLASRHSSNVLQTRLTHRLYTGSANGLKPLLSAAVIEERHYTVLVITKKSLAPCLLFTSNKGKRSVLSSLISCHFLISGGMMISINSGLFRAEPTTSARVPTVS